MSEEADAAAAKDNGEAGSGETPQESPDDLLKGLTLGGKAQTRIITEREAN